MLWLSLNFVYYTHTQPHNEHLTELLCSMLSYFIHSHNKHRHKTKLKLNEMSLTFPAPQLWRWSLSLSSGGVGVCASVCLPGVCSTPLHHSGAQHRPCSASCSHYIFIPATLNSGDPLSKNTAPSPSSSSASLPFFLSLSLTLLPESPEAWRPLISALN